ncbi:MAG: InlB B-repeat-containing protein, partial [Treponema sp.]|nr:InlB B-repeat-containing protein [Treponema sp.]
MKKINYKIILVLLILLCSCFTTCDNPIIAKWWPEPETPKIVEQPPVVVPPSGGSGDNFGVVVFDTDGGIPQPKALKIAWGGVVGRLRPITRGGDGFIGWFDENGNLWDVETQQVKKTDDDDGDGFITLTVKWEPYTTEASICIVRFITYPPSSFPNSSPPDAAVIIPDQYVAQGSKVVQPAQPPVLPAPDNRGFAGWFTDESYDYRFDFNLPVPSNPSLTLYAKWVEIYRTVIFNANGGRRPDSYTELNHQFTVPLSDDPPNPSDPEYGLYGLVQDPGPIVKDGYSFAGWWYYDSVFNVLSAWNFATKKVTDSDVPTDDPLILYAKWERNIYNVNFVVPTSSTAAAPPTQKVTHGDTVVRPVDPQGGDGRAFAGWYTDADFNVQWDFGNPVTSTMTLYARFLTQTRTVHFQVNGGRTPGGMDFLPNRTILVPDGKIIDPGTLNREGFTFGGWFADPECTVSWNFNTPVTQPDNVAGEDPMYLYAKWTMNPHTVRFSVGGSEVATQSVIHGEKAQAPVITVPSGQALDGWYKNSNCSGSWNFDNDTVTSGITLYGQWKKREFVVRYHLGTGSGNSAGIIPQSYKPADQYYAADGRVVEPSMPVNLNPNEWSFLRWDCAFPVQSNDVSNINNTSWRNNLHSYNRFGMTIDDMYTITEGSGSVEVLNLYARWVPPVPDMVWVPRGSFEMGDSSVSGNPAAYHAYPTRRVKVDGFYMSKYEVSEVDSPSGTIRGYRIV